MLINIKKCNSVSSKKTSTHSQSIADRNKSGIRIAVTGHPLSCHWLSLELYGRAASALPPPLPSALLCAPSWPHPNQAPRPAPCRPSTVGVGFPTARQGGERRYKCRPSIHAWRQDCSTCLSSSLDASSIALYTLSFGSKSPNRLGSTCTCSELGQLKESFAFGC